MTSIHFKCERDGSSFRLLSKIEGNTYRTCCWDISEAEAQGLVGGWLYLHPLTKHDLSEFGGKILRYEITGDGEGYPGRIAFVFEARQEGRKQKWRGQSHGMAWTGRSVTSDLPHELKDA